MFHASPKKTRACADFNYTFLDWMLLFHNSRSHFIEVSDISAEAPLDNSVYSFSRCFNYYYYYFAFEVYL